MGRRKSKKNLGSIISAVAALLGVAAVVMLFLPNVASKNGNTTFTGLQIVFGYSKTVPLLGDIQVLQFSFMNLFVYLLAIGGVVFALIGGNGKLFTLISVAAFVAAGVLFIISPSFVLANSAAEQAGFKLSQGLKLAYGSIVGAVVTFLAGAAQGYKFLFK